MKRTWLLFTCYTILLLSCSERSKNTIQISGLQHECMQLLTHVIVQDILTPPVANRIYTYSNLAWYEAIKFTNGSPSITNQLRGFEKMPAPSNKADFNFTLAAVKAFFKVSKTLSFSKDSLIKKETDLINQFKLLLNEKIYSNSISLGDSIAGLILKRATADNYKKTRGMPRYSVQKEAGKWEQTPPDYSDAVEPNWRMIMPLLLDSAAQFKPAPPPAYSMDKKSAYYKELLEVYEIGKHINSSMDTIAHYWDDNPFVTEHSGHFTLATKKTTPGGHWMGIIHILCNQYKTDEIKTAKAYALASCAMFDGFISCWDEKYRSRMVRPVTVIRELLEPDWKPLLQTPPFPEYTSGHSVITAAAASVLSNLFGSNASFVDTTELKYLGLVRSFSSIQAASKEAAISRLYGGIHYRSAIEQGEKQGQAIGGLYNHIFY